ncbi:MAG: 2-amino-4-hydroxy-6-hydroxymethyldihydropteridine diphosphokinase [Phaeodactylibacter sp.]|nr:2-amino-4-hydroxy-6-hydroxymethyldihydropteridine diphosphokinase [Phaeodactylibacter sp.]
MNRVVVAIGSNIDPKANVKQALAWMAREFAVVKKSEFVYTEPLLYHDQPKFLNGSVLIETPLGQGEIVTILKRIEKELGRIRTANKNGPRTIDLDVVVVNGEIVDNDVYERDFLRRAVEELLPGLL